MNASPPLFPANSADGASWLAAQEARLRALGEAAAARLTTPDRHVGVVGAGTMGRTIALAALEAGFTVTLMDNDARQLASAAEDLARWTAKAGLAVSAVLTDDVSALTGADIVIESVFEDETVKAEILRRIEAPVTPQTLIATNSSTLDIDRLSASLRHPERFIGTHFFLPAHRTPVLEIVAGKASSAITRDRALALANRLGKLPVRAGNGDGYVGNRLFDRFWQEALFLVEEGAAPSDVDAALTGWGMALGPLTTLDRIGNDLLAGVLARRAARQPAIRQPQVLAHLVEAGRMGVRTRAGWYDYGAGSRHGTPSPAVEALIALFAAQHGATGQAATPAQIVERCVRAVVNEAQNLLAEGMAECAGDIDVMFTRAYGFPASTGGPLHLGATLQEDVSA